MTKRALSLRSAVMPGVVDAAAASAATFAAGIYAARYLTPQLLGIYALFFAAFGLTVVFAWRLVFMPCEIEFLAIDTTERTKMLGTSLRFGGPVAFAAGLIMVIPWILSASEVDGSTVAPLAITALVAAWLSPIQDHIRRLHHLAERSWAAAAISIVQLAAAATFLIVAIVTGLDPVWGPFGALATANAVSLPVGLVLSRRPHGPSPHIDLNWRSLLRSGRWILAIGLLPSVAAFVASAMVLLIVGSELLGYAEAARIVARPLGVLLSGFGAVVSPRAMEAAKRRDESTAKSVTRLTYFLVPGAAIAVLAVAGINWVGNPLTHVIPNAYEILGLVALAIVANAAVGMSLSQQGQLLGARREAVAAGVTAAGAVATIAVTASTFVTEAYAIPLGMLAGALTRWYLYQRQTRKLYETPTD